MKLIHINGDEATVVMESPSEDHLKDRAKRVPGFPEKPIWDIVPIGKSSSKSPLIASQGEPKELMLDDGSKLRITHD